MSEAIVAFMKDQGEKWAIDQARRIRVACELFVELIGDRQVAEVDRDLIRRYRKEILPRVPANENKVRLTRGTRSVSESMTAVAGTNWPTLSEGEQVKRMHSLGRLFQWVHTEGWITDDPTLGQTSATKKSGEKKVRQQDRRECFTDADFALIFGAPWFKEGRGTLTRQNTYREFLPFYYWLPLLGLYTGARINELCQLALADLKVSASGTWFIDITDDNVKRLKNQNAVRRVPVHPHLLELGLIQWHSTLSSAGYPVLFPELRHDNVKGHSKDAVKWFSTYLKRLGIPRNSRKVFHSFRHGLSTIYLNELGLPTQSVNSLLGWERGSGTGLKVYRKDELPEQLIEAVAKVKFNLPPIAVFDADAGLKAAADALRRKNRGRGAGEE